MFFWGGGGGGGGRESVRRGEAKLVLLIPQASEG